MKGHWECLQINLQHSKAASSALGGRLARGRVRVGLIQEPWVHRGSIKGLQNPSYHLVYNTLCGRPRAALIFRKDINYAPIPEFVSQDLVAAVVDVPTGSGKRRTVIASAYFPSDRDNPPPEAVKGLMDWCRRNGKQLIMGCDANAHHTVWGSSDINNRGKYLFDYVCASGLDIINRGNKPTFINAIRQEVLDLTLATAYGAQLIKNWRVLAEPSMSDHQTIAFDMEAVSTEIAECRVPRKTDWVLYNECLQAELQGLQYNIATTEELEEASRHLRDTIVAAYEKSCPVKKVNFSRNVPWWNKELDRLRTSARKSFNRAKRIGNWTAYRQALTEYNRKLRESKREAWKAFCEGIDNLTPANRLRKVLSKDHTNAVGILKRTDGSHTNDQQESLELLLGTHFPGSKVMTNNTMATITDLEAHCSNRDSRCWAGKIFTPSKMTWAISSFKPYKSPGMDGIFPALLQRGLESIAPGLKEIYKASYALGYIPRLWREAKVIFIPKVGNRPLEEPKSYRPISLTSFLLKTMEKIIDEHIKSDSLIGTPLNANQFAYQAGKSTVDALHHLVKEAERAILHKEIALAVFVDIEGAFDNTSFSAIKRAASNKGIYPSTIKWVESMLQSRLVTASLAGSTATMTVAKGCPQGGVLSPTLWSIVVDSLLDELQEKGFTAQGYADDIAIIIRGKHEGILTSLMQQALNIINNWCVREELSVNPNKTIIVPFTHRRKLHMKAPMLNGIEIKFSNEAKYLGVTLDAKLTWNQHVDKTMAKATASFWACRQLMGKTWGLKPKITYWLYRTAVIPIVTYAALVWWPKTQQISTQKKLDRLQRLACLSITGAMQTTPTAGMEAIIGLPPLHLAVQKEGLVAALRLHQRKKTLPGDWTGHLQVLQQIDPALLSKPTDIMSRKLDIDSPFKVVIEDPKTASKRIKEFGRGISAWYTDGAKNNKGTGIGIYGPNQNHRSFMSLGNTPTIMQAEAIAIDVCARECLNRHLNGAHIYICSDSQAVLKAVRAYSHGSWTVWECRRSLSQLAKNNSLTLMWVPGHEGIEGNEVADELAKRGANAIPFGPEPFCGLPTAHRREVVQKWEEDKRRTYWNNVPGLRQSKRLIKPDYSRKVLELTRNELRIFTGLMTGHCALRYHLKKMGKEESENCRLCESAAETAEHILCTCDAIAHKRFSHFGRDRLSHEEVSSITPKKVTKFIEDVGLLGR